MSAERSEQQEDQDQDQEEVEALAWLEGNGARLALRRYELGEPSTGPIVTERAGQVQVCVRAGQAGSLAVKVRALTAPSQPSSRLA